MRSNVQLTDSEIADALAPVRGKLIARVAHHSKTQRRVRVAGVVSLAIVGVGMGTAAVNNHAFWATAAPANVAPEYQSELSDCMQRAGWEPLPGEPAGDSSFHFRIAPSQSDEWGIDMTACFDEVADANGVDDVFLH